MFWYLLSAELKKPIRLNILPRRRLIDSFPNTLHIHCRVSAKVCDDVLVVGLIKAAESNIPTHLAIEPVLLGTEGKANVHVSLIHSGCNRTNFIGIKNIPNVVKLDRVANVSHCRVNHTLSLFLVTVLFILISFERRYTTLTINYCQRYNPQKYNMFQI
jgi:hypothetical protein